MRLILGHMGEMLPFFLWRLDQRARAFADHTPVVTPSELVRCNIWITTAGAFTDEPLRCALNAVGEGTHRTDARPGAVIRTLHMCVRPA